MSTFRQGLCALPLEARAALALIVLCQALWGSPLLAAGGHVGEHGPSTGASGSRHHSGAALAGWEGSREGIAYSEFNHHVAGGLVLLIGSAELSQALRSSSALWARLLLPAALGAAGLFLLIWSDHEAWPIGHLTISQTFLGGDHEIVQHKLYGILALATACLEVLRRTGRLKHGGWMVPLPGFAILGGWMLFNHSHGTHPAADKIAVHHAVMGTLAITAGSSRLVSAWNAEAVIPARARCELLWGALIAVIGLQLLLYSE